MLRQPVRLESVVRTFRRSVKLIGSPIEAWLDIPLEGSSAAGVLAISGWAFSTAAPVVKVQACLDGTPPCAVRYGLARKDVLAAFPGRAPLECGYEDLIQLGPTPPGTAILKVQIADALGNRREIARTILVASPPIQLVVDRPRPDSVSAGIILVEGWAYSSRSRIVGIDARLGTRPQSALPHGFRRPDLEAAFGDPAAGRSGFRGIVRFEPDASETAERLVVRATDDRGESVEAEVTVRITPAGKPVCEIEQARWRGDLLEVEGLAVWPGSASPRTARILVDGKLVGETRLNLSRPDLQWRFPAQPAGARCGFRVSTRYFPDAGQTGKEGELTVECVDREGRRIWCTTQVPHEPCGMCRADSGVLDGAEEVLSHVRNRLERDPTVLDWNSGLGLGRVVSRLVVFSPPGADAPRLPYLDGTVDVVALSSADPVRVAEARRVAATAVLRLSATAPAFLEWKPEATTLSSMPRTSIIVPAHDKASYTDACLTQLLATLPQEFHGEILVVDDASTDDTPAMLDRWITSSVLVRRLRNVETLGFLRSCNHGADAATGEILVFLNNDTLPQPGWLPPLLRLLRDRPRAGAVGGKLVYPDGTLQEAGGVIFSDGSGCNFGRYSVEANAPLYSYPREVDYCSGALLAIPRALFLELGGFDSRFSPAYYEDTDLCFRLRERGYKVYYQPESVVVHYEGVSSGTDTSSGVKRWQVINREKFKEKWAESLMRQPPPPKRLDARTLHALSVRDDRPRALVCAPRMPEYDRESGSRRIFNFLEFLQEAGWAVSFVAQDATASEPYVRVLQQLGVATYAGPESALVGGEYLEDIDELIAAGQFDLAILAFWNIGEQLLPRIRSLSPSTRVIVDSVDLHFLRGARGVLRRSHDGERRGVLDQQYADWMIRELNTYAAADGVLTVSQKEADLVNDIAADHALAHCVPDAESLACSPVAFAERKGILFIGNFRHPPNVEALKYLCTEILPRLDRALLAAHPVYVVGNALETLEDVMGEVENVRFVGWAPSVVPYLERARVSVIPLLHGAGTKRKLIQALMVGTPSVSTRIGVEGLNLEDGLHVRVADDPADFAARIAELVEDQGLWSRLAIQGRAHIEIAHGRDAVRARLLAVIDKVMARPEGANRPWAGRSSGATGVRCARKA